jgi:intein-encoded DNA endonuclease-like protein
MFDIADRLGCTHSTVVYKFQRLGIQSRGHLGLIPPLKLSKETLEYLYYKRRLSLKKIAKILHRSEGGVERRFNKFGLTSRGNSNRACKYKKHDFSGNLEEKAYMVGFRLGDLNVYDKVNVIQVRCSSTHKAQIDVIKTLFASYTTPFTYNSLDDGYQKTHIICLVNKSFDFLVPKEDKIPKWVLSDTNTFWAFFAGYSDAEGSLMISKDGTSQVKRRVGFELATYDKNILFTLRSNLKKFGISSYFRLSSPKGTIIKSGLKRGKNYYSNGDCWRLSVQTKQSLWILIYYWKCFAKHKEKVSRIKSAEENLRRRNYIKWSKPIDLSIPTLNTHPSQEETAGAFYPRQSLIQ